MAIADTRQYFLAARIRSTLALLMLWLSTWSRGIKKGGREPIGLRLALLGVGRKKLVFRLKHQVTQLMSGINRCRSPHLEVFKKT